MLQAALDLLDEVGLDALTVRRLAERLEVRPGALYRHFESKRALLDAMVAALLATEQAPPPSDGGWDGLLRWMATSARAAMLTHRDGARLLITYLTPGSAVAEEGWNQATESLRPAGLSQAAAQTAVDTLFAYANGFTMEEQSRDGFPQPPAQRARRDRAFEAGLDLIVAGIRARAA